MSSSSELPQCHHRLVVVEKCDTSSLSRWPMMEGPSHHGHTRIRP